MISTRLSPSLFPTRSHADTISLLEKKPHGLVLVSNAALAYGAEDDRRTGHTNYSDSHESRSSSRGIQHRGQDGPKRCARRLKIGGNAYVLRGADRPMWCGALRCRPRV